MKNLSWQEKIVSPEKIIEKIKPGMNIFLGTGVAEPRTLVKELMKNPKGNLEDIELIQIVSFGKTVSLNEIKKQKYRLKTFFPGVLVNEAIDEGYVDLIPTRFSWIPKLIETGQIPINIAFIQITPPDKTGNCSMGVAIDVARQAIEKASLVVGEINTSIPRTFGDTFIHISDFDFLVQSDLSPFYFERWPTDIVNDQVAANVSSLIDDGSCIAFSIGPLYEALGQHLKNKKNLGVHSPIFTDSLMELIQSGAVSNRKKETYTGKSLASYAMGTPELFSWLDQNPLIEFQGIGTVYNPVDIGANSNFIAVLPARKIDLSGRIALKIGKGNVATGPAEVLEFFNGAEISKGGRTIFALPSRNRKGFSNILTSVKDYPNRFPMFEFIDMVVTEYGVAYLKGYSMRERAQALIDIAHPDDRPSLIEHAKSSKIIYKDQIFIPKSGKLYPSEIRETHVLRGGTKVLFRPIKPSDEEQMRRLFYRFSDEAVYSRYFILIRSMPHAKMQEYVNIDWEQTMSIVGIVKVDQGSRVIAEARYILETDQSFAEIVFVVDEKFQGHGIGTLLFKLLTRLAKERKLKGFSADVLSTNKGMIKVFKKGSTKVNSTLEDSVYHFTMPF
jgi:acyl-CoA hydrolase/RimJ/RimL family protein N-acetyltransferase